MGGGGGKERAGEPGVGEAGVGEGEGGGPTTAVFPTLHSPPRLPGVLFLPFLLLLLLMRSPAGSLGFTILGEILAYVTVFFFFFFLNARQFDLPLPAICPVVDT